MFRSGLVSITFRRLSAREVCRVAAEAGLEGIEWGGDVHVPAGDIEVAKQAATLAADHGLAVAAYGSYYRAGASDPDDFSRVIDSAEALGAPIVRVWCGNEGSDVVEHAERAAVTDDCRRISELADDAGLTIACEWHGQTLTDTGTSAAQLFSAVDHPAFRTYWQPRTGQPAAVSLSEMEVALPRLVGVHVFEWSTTPPVQRLALAEGDAVWPGYLARIKDSRAVVDTTGNRDLFALLEFVRDDDPANLAADATTLRRWLAEVNA